MPEELKQSEVSSQTDPSVAKQYDNETPKEDQWKDLFKFIDGQKVTLLNTYRKGTGPVGRSMAIAKRDGPDILYLANKHSKKFSDIDANPEVQITIQDSKTQDWISISGTVTTTDNSDPRIKELYTPTISAWFGDLGDGIHKGNAEDPRMTLIEVKAKYIVHWQKEVNMLSFVKEIGQAALTGSVAQTGVHREFSEAEISKERAS